MVELLVLDLVEKRLVTDQLVLTIGYDIENLTDSVRSAKYHGEVTIDHYGRKVPKHAHGTANIEKKTSSTSIIMEAVMSLFDRIVNKDLLVRRVNISANKLISESEVVESPKYEQLELFVDYDALQEKQYKEKRKKLLDK